MRGLTAAVVAGVVVILVAAALYLRNGSTGESAAPPAPRVQPQAAAPKGSERSARVEERLSQLRDDIEHRQVGAANPPPNKRGVPTMAARQPARDEDDSGEEPADSEDPKEMAELKHTLMSDPDPDERIGAVLMLTGEEGPESMRMLLEAMDDPDPEVRLAVVEALGDRSEELSPDTLHTAVGDPDAEVRFEAVSILGDMESPEALQMVRLALNDNDDDVRALAEGILDFADDDEGNGDTATQQAHAPTPRQNGQPAHK